MDQTTMVFSEVIQKTSVAHELRDDVERLLSGTDGVQSHQLSVSQLFHDLGFVEKLRWIH